ELLPGGVHKALQIMAPGLRFEDAWEYGSQQQLVLELGMGRGRLAAQLFFMGCTVIGVELANERFLMAAAALERLAHRCSHTYEMSRRGQEARIRKKDGPVGALCEVRQGNFLDRVTKEEVAAATLVILQVFLPKSVWPQLRIFLEELKGGCRILSYEDLRQTVWAGTLAARYWPAVGPLRRGTGSTATRRLALEASSQGCCCCCWKWWWWLL
ncbi:unnamed protein product, partial [Polarella glacialis]